MSIQEIEFRYPPFKFTKEANSATGKSYFKNNSTNINNVAIKTTDKSIKIYQIDSISVLPGSALRQNSNHAYLVVQNKGKVDVSDVVFLCFKLEPGNESSLDVFNNKVGVKRIEIDSSNPSSTIRISSDEKIIILDSSVKISQIPVLSKYHNIIGTSDLTFNTKTISGVKRVTTTATCKTVQNTLDNIIPEKQKMIIHTIMLILTFIIAVGAWVGKGIVIQPITNNALLGIWFLLVMIMAPIVNSRKTAEIAKIALVIKYLVSNIIILAAFFNFDLLKSVYNDTNFKLFDKLREILLSSNKTELIKAGLLLLGIGFTIVLFSA